MYFFSNSINASFEVTVLATKDALKRHGFEVLAEIDMRKTFTEHLVGDFRPYLILIAYDPISARRAVQIFDKIGSNLLCNVVVQTQNDDCADVSVADPAKTMYVINHVELDWIIRDLRGHLQKAIEGIEIRSETRRPLPARDEAMHVNYVVDGYDIGFQAGPYSVDVANVAARSCSGIEDDDPIAIGRSFRGRPTERGEAYPDELSERRSRTDNDLRFATPAHEIHLRSSTSCPPSPQGCRVVEDHALSPASV